MLIHLKRGRFLRPLHIVKQPEQHERILRSGLARQDSPEPEKNRIQFPQASSSAVPAVFFDDNAST